MGLYAGRKNIQGFHCFVVSVEVVLHYFHGLELFEASLLCNFVFAIVRVVFQVSDVGDIAYIAHLVSQVSQIAQYDVKSYGGAGVSRCASPYTVGPQTYMPTRGACRGLKASLPRLIEL